MTLVRHVGVFCVLLAVAAVLSFLAPLSISARTVFLGAIIVFVFYIGVSHLLSARAAAKATAEKTDE